MTLHYRLLPGIFKPPLQLGMARCGKGSDKLRYFPMKKRVLYAAGPRWVAMAEQLDVLMADGGFRALKDEARTCAGLLKGPDGAWVFVKRVRTGSWARGLIASARGSRVRRWLEGAAMLSMAGFNRPAPLAALEVRHAGAVNESYLICEALNDATVLSGAVLGGGKVHFRSRRSLLSAVAREVRRLHDAGLYTRDLQETNLMVQERGGASLHNSGNYATGSRAATARARRAWRPWRRRPQVSCMARGLPPRTGLRRRRAATDTVDIYCIAELWPSRFADASTITTRSRSTRPAAPACAT
jgi:hypothetical protein